MKLGFLTAPFPETSLTDVADWAASAGFEVLEIACWPVSSGATRKYAGTAHIDVANLTDAQASEIKGELADKGLDISGLGFYPNPLHPDPEARAAAIEHLKAVIVATGRMGLPVTNTFCGGDARKNVDENWEEALKVWPDIVGATFSHSTPPHAGITKRRAVDKGRHLYFGRLRRREQLHAFHRQHPG